LVKAGEIIAWKQFGRREGRPDRPQEAEAKHNDDKEDCRCHGNDGGKSAECYRQGHGMFHLGKP
jgi:hypothetical protein